MTSRTALIVGAGIGGLAVAVGLRAAGWRVRVFERAANPRELGFALNLAPNAINALRELGLAERVVAEGSIVGRTEIRSDGGRVLKRFDVASGLSHTPSVVVLRPALHGILLNAVERPSLSLESEAIRFEITPPGVVLKFRDGRREAGDLLVGADGVGSVIRRILHPDEAPPRPSGYYGVRGVAYGAGQALGDLSAVAYLADGVEAATARASQDAVYWYMSLLAADVGAARDARALAARHAALLDEPIRAIVAATRPEDLRMDELFDRDPLDEWGRGPVTLLGDAAHPMLPHTGQGAAQALEDAVALGLACASGRDVVQGLRRYERVRAQRTRSLVTRGRRIARFTTTRSHVIRGLRGAAIRLAPPKAMAAAYLLAGQGDPHRALRGNESA